MTKRTITAASGTLSTFIGRVNQALGYPNAHTTAWQSGSPSSVEWHTELDDEFYKYVGWDSFWWDEVPTDAEYVPVNMLGSNGIKTIRFRRDISYLVVADNTTPGIDAKVAGSWSNRDSGTQVFATIHPRVPNDLVVPDASAGNTPNNPFLNINKDTGAVLAKLNGFCRPTEGGDCWGYAPPGTHAGSGITGGEITEQDITRGSINHAVSILINQPLLSSAGAGYVSPAVNADSDYNTPGNAKQYTGSNPLVVMGTRFAIPRDVMFEGLGLSNPYVEMLFNAFQKYGAYVTDSSGWDAVYINPVPEVDSLFSGSTIENEMFVVLEQLRIVQ